MALENRPYASLEEAHYAGLDACEEHEVKEDAAGRQVIPCRRGQLANAGEGRLKIVYLSNSGKKYELFPYNVEGWYALTYPANSTLVGLLDITAG